MEKKRNSFFSREVRWSTSERARAGRRFCQQRPSARFFVTDSRAPSWRVSGPLLLSSFRQTSCIDVFEQLLIGIEECKEEKEHLTAER